MTFRAYLVDDEARALELLRNYIERVPSVEWVGEARDPLKALAYLATQQVDVLFLDINLPNLSGIDFYARLNHQPKIIFTTAYPEFAVKGFDLAAVDYLLKPITFERFAKACSRLAKNQWTDQPTDKKMPQDLIYVKSGATLHKILANEILYLERDENYVVYHTTKKRILTRQTLSQLEATLPDYFVRIHKSYIVSLLHLDSMRSDQVYLKNQVIPIGKTYRSLLYNRLRQT